ncbi:MAG: 2-isopropylmalate synthase [Vicinamibacterales bacterium]
MADRVFVFDTTLRDGEQSPGCSMTAREKLAMARTLADLGVDVIEAGFPVASDGDFAAVSAIARECRGPVVAGLARATAGDIDRAAKAVEGAARPRVHTFIATSDIHLRHKLRKTRAQVLDEAVAAVERARRLVGDVEFSAEDATRTDPGYLEEVARAAVAAGARTINVPDTVGYATPDEFSALVRRLVSAVGDRVVISVHCHDDLGLAVANSIAAIQAGARQVECTVNGIGERAGNCSLEEVVMILKVRADCLPYRTGVRTEGLYPASRRLAEIISFGPQPNKAVVGRNAFSHEAGIHQDGVLKEPATYEIMRPEMVGVPESRLVLGKHSGRHALAKRCADLGYTLTRDEIESVYRMFTALADRKKGVMDEEIVRMIRMETARRPGGTGTSEAAAAKGSRPWI